MSEMVPELDRLRQLPDEPTKTWGKMKKLSIAEVFGPSVATEVQDLGAFVQTIGKPDQYRIVTVPNEGRLTNDLRPVKQTIIVAYRPKRRTGCLGLLVARIHAATSTYPRQELPMITKHVGNQRSRQNRIVNFSLNRLR